MDDSIRPAGFIDSFRNALSRKRKSTPGEEHAFQLTRLKNKGWRPIITGTRCFFSLEAVIPNNQVRPTIVHGIVSAELFREWW